MLNRTEEAQMCIIKGKEIASYYKALRFLKGKLELIDCSIRLKSEQVNPKDILVELDETENLFFDLAQYEGAGEVRFLKALALIKSISIIFNDFSDREFVNR